MKRQVKSECDGKGEGEPSFANPPPQGLRRARATEGEVGNLEWFLMGVGLGLGIAGIALGVCVGGVA